jgi:hypothetical protein
MLLGMVGSAWHTVKVHSVQNDDRMGHAMAHICRISRARVSVAAMLLDSIILACTATHAWLPLRVVMQGFLKRGGKMAHGGQTLPRHGMRTVLCVSM